MHRGVWEAGLLGSVEARGWESGHEAFSLKDVEPIHISSLIHIYIYTHIYIYIHVLYVKVCIHIHVHLYMYTYIYI